MTTTIKLIILEDPVDRYTRTWAVLILLVLALLSIQIPLAQPPSFQAGDQVGRENLPHPGSNDPSLHRYTAVCWCPAQFESSHIDYTQRVCSVAFSQVMSGGSYRKGSLAATIHRDDLSETEFWFGKNFPHSRTPDSDTSDTGEQSTNRELEKESIISKSYFYITPMVVFLFAITLELPHIIWILCSPMLTSGIGQTAFSLGGTQLSDKDYRQKVARDVASAIHNSNKGSLFSTSLLYLVLKTTTFLLAFSAVVLLKTLNIINGTSTSSANEYSNTPLKCYFSIKQMSNTHSYNVQCIFSHENPGSSVLYLLVVALFSIVAVVNFLSFFIWIVRLSYLKKKDFSNKNLATDVYFLLYMTRLQMGHLLARDLEEAFYVQDNSAEEELNI